MTDDEFFKLCEELASDITKLLLDTLGQMNIDPMNIDPNLKSNIAIHSLAFSVAKNACMVLSCLPKENTNIDYAIDDIGNSLISAYKEYMRFQKDKIIEAMDVVKAIVVKQAGGLH